MTSASVHLQKSSTSHDQCFKTPHIACLSCSHLGHVQDLNKEPRHDAGVSLSHLVTGVHGKRVHCCGALLSHLCHHGGAAVWGAFLDLQRHFCGKQGGSRRATAQRMTQIVPHLGMLTTGALKACSNSRPLSICQDEHQHSSSCSRAKLYGNAAHHASICYDCLHAAWCVPVIPCSACLYSRLWLQLRSVSLCLEVIYIPI